MAIAAMLSLAAVLCLCTHEVSVMGLPVEGLTMIEEEPATKRRGMSMIEMLRNPYESFDDIARQNLRSAVQGYFDVMNKIGKMKTSRSVSTQPSQGGRDNSDSYIKRYI
uniref:Uncharacterized protein n=1 Tax=Plectus sambesii TaxID=2011161 RepID=A0A914VSY2_9BILA